MNPAQGSPPSASPGETSQEDRPAGSMGTDELELSPVRRCKTKSLDLPFSVESLISDRTPCRSLHSPEPGSGCVGVEETECASPRGLYRSTAEAVDLSDKETSTWVQASYASPTSECGYHFRINSKEPKLSYFQLLRRSPETLAQWCSCSNCITYLIPKLFRVAYTYE